MRLCVLTLCALLTFVSVPGCGGRIPPPATAGAIAPTTANNIVMVLGALQTAAIVLAPIDGIPAGDTSIVVTGVGDAIQIVQAGKTGWVSALDTAFSTIEPQLSSSSQATLGPWINAVYASITALYGSGVA